MDVARSMRCATLAYVHVLECVLEYYMYKYVYRLYKVVIVYMFILCGYPCRHNQETWSYNNIIDTNRQ